MPRSIQISQKERYWFKVALEEKFNLKIEDSHSCSKLSDLIYETTKISINYNTLRRLFKIVPYQNAPSLYTLNELSRVLGFSDFQSFRSLNEKLDKDFIHETLHIFKISKVIEDELLTDVIDHLTIESWESVYQLRALIELLIQHKKLEKLTHFLNFELDEYNWEFIFKYYIAFQPLHLEAKTKNKYVIEFLMNQINHSKILQLILLQLYVEEDELDHYFGQLISACSNYMTSDMDIFLKCMKIQLAFQKKDFPLAEAILNEINSRENAFQHPIILGRISAWNYLLKNDKTIFKYFIKQVKEPSQRLSIITFFYRLTLDYGGIEKFREIDEIKNFPIEEINFNLLDFNKKAEIELFYLLSAKYFFENQNISLAKKHFQKVTGKFRFSCTLKFFNKEFKFLKDHLN